MKIVQEFPPNIDKIRDNFTLHKGIVFTYGDTIYAPDGGHISDDLVIHEMTHASQQGKQPDYWWQRYFADIDFRFAQELEAYQAQYQFYCKFIKDREKRNKFLLLLSSDLSSEMYGSICSKLDAYSAIRNGLKIKVGTNDNRADIKK